MAHNHPTYVSGCFRCEFVSTEPRLPAKSNSIWAPNLRAYEINTLKGDIAQINEAMTYISRAGTLPREYRRIDQIEELRAIFNLLLDKVVEAGDFEE